MGRTADDKLREEIFFTDDISTAEHKCFLRTVGLSIQQSSHLLSVLVNISTRFHASNELSRRNASCYMDVYSYL